MKWVGGSAMTRTRPRSAMAENVVHLADPNRRLRLLNADTSLLASRACTWAATRANLEHRFHQWRMKRACETAESGTPLTCGRRTDPHRICRGLRTGDHRRFGR